MKTKLLSLFALLTSAVFAQQADTITFEDLNLSPDTYWDGVGGATDTVVNFGFLDFHNYDDYGYWLGGFAYSTITDTTDKATYFSAISAKGYNNSNTYAIGQGGAMITHHNVSDIEEIVTGVYITNSTYAYESLKKGDMFAKKFGGVSGNDPDWFKLSIYGISSETGYSDTVEFYLADFRFSDNNSDYIVKDWTFVDLTSIGSADTLIFDLSSTDKSGIYMNTPSFFCMDNVEFDRYVSVDELENNFVFSVYPNPASNNINIDFQDKKVNTISILDASGRVVYTELVNTSKVNVDLSNLTSGIYYLQSSGSNFISTNKLIKN